MKRALYLILATHTFMANASNAESFPTIHIQNFASWVDRFSPDRAMLFLRSGDPTQAVREALHKKGYHVVVRPDYFSDSAVPGLNLFFKNNYEETPSGLTYLSSKFCIGESEKNCVQVEQVDKSETTLDFSAHLVRAIQKIETLSVAPAPLPDSRMVLREGFRIGARCESYVIGSRGEQFSSVLNQHNDWVIAPLNDGEEVEFKYSAKMKLHRIGTNANGTRYELKLRSEEYESSKYSASKSGSDENQMFIDVDPNGRATFTYHDPILQRNIPYPQMITVEQSWVNQRRRGFLRKPLLESTTGKTVCILSFLNAQRD